MRHHIRWIGALLVGLVPAIVAGEEKPVAPPAPFSIPQFDLSARKELQVTVDREAGQYLGHPTTVLLEDGRTMIIVYPKGHGRGGIVMKRSTDGGLTWSERLPVPASWATSMEVPTLYRTIDKAGKKRLIMFSGLYPIRQAVSEDDGATWSELAPIGDYGGIVACASCTRLQNGDYMALFHDDGRFLTKKPLTPNPSPARGEGSNRKNSERPKPKFVVYKIISSDGGLTWSKPEPIATHDVAHLCEPGLVRSPDGKQLAVLLRENARKLRSFIIFSNDEGATWSEPREVPAALTGDRHTCAYLKDGKLFITFRDQLKGSPSPGDWVAWVGTYDDLVNGGEGLYRLRLMDNTKGADCAYPPVEVLPDGTVVTTTYGHWTAGEEPYIMSVRLSPAVLDSFAKPIKDEMRISLNGRLTEVQQEMLTWQRLADLNDPQGFAGQFVGTINNKLVLYGGTNFPGKKVWEGGTKVWYRDVFVLDDPNGAWRKIGKLPEARAVGYGVSISTDEGLLCIGGATATEHLTDVFLLGLDGDQLTTRDLPKLPAPNAYMTGAQIGSVIYVAGGLAKPDDVRTMRTFWSLDLKNLDAGWQVLEPWPGNARMLAVTAAVDGKFYLSGGTDLWTGPEGKSIRAYQNDSFCYTPGRGWKKIASAPTGIVAAPTPAVVDGSKIIVFGGDDGSRLGHKPPQDHPGFPKSVYTYDTSTDQWERIGQAPFVPVATPIVRWHGGYVTASGEIRPAVRSREVWMLRLSDSTAAEGRKGD